LLIDIILEIGCGTGALTTHLIDLFGTKCDLIGIEIDQRFFEN